MRDFVFIVCSLILVTASQAFGQSSSTTQVTSQAVQPIPMPATAQAAATPQATAATQQVAQPSVQSQLGTLQSHDATAQPAVYHSSQPVYYQQQSVQRTYQPARQTFYYAPRPQRVYYNSNPYGNIPITQRPNRPGHPYGNMVRFINRLGR